MKKLIDKFCIGIFILLYAFEATFLYFYEIICSKITKHKSLEDMLCFKWINFCKTKKWVD